MDVYLAEADNYARQVVAEHLQDAGHPVHLLAAADELLPALAAGPASAGLILADLPPGRVRSTAAALRLVHHRFPAIPVVLRAAAEVLPAAEAVGCGVHGYLTKPFRSAELDLILIRLAERQSRQSLQDEASGLYHRAGFAALARQQLKTARRTGTEMVLLRADVTGQDPEQAERAVGELGRVVQRTFREADMAGRVNGTDCGVLLVKAGAVHTQIAVRRLRQNLAAHSAGSGQPLQVRVGVAHYDPAQPASFEELVARADAASPTNGSAPGA